VDEVTMTGDGYDPTTKGILDFFSSQTEVVLAQYQNINQLLGKTDHWTHPGILCEVLLRDFIRRNLWAWMQVDKGFIFGRTERSGTDQHSPEIDVLIHDAKEYRPIFRLDDFVIVQPEAPLGAIQVKRKLDSAECRNGINNVVAAKSHTFHTLCEKRRIFVADQLPSVFTAVVGFEHDMSSGQQFAETVKGYLQEATNNVRAIPWDQKKQGRVAMLPEFIGSLMGCFAVHDAKYSQPDKHRYVVFDSRQADKYWALQVVFARFCQCHGRILCGRQPPFYLPPVSEKPPWFDIELPLTG
jgi:hypothetical protein